MPSPAKKATARLVERIKRIRYRLTLLEGAYQRRRERLITELAFIQADCPHSNTYIQVLAGIILGRRCYTCGFYLDQEGEECPSLPPLPNSAA